MLVRTRKILALSLSPLLLAAIGCSAAQDDSAVNVDGNADIQGGSKWGGGGGKWGGGGSQWGGGGGMFAGGGGSWGGGGSFWGGGGSKWGGGGNQWAGGGGQWAGGGSYWAGGGSWWAGGGSSWGGGGGNWGGGFTTTFPFVGYSCAPGSATNCARNWHFDGVPKAGYSATTPPAFSVAKDTGTCAAGTVRVGGFAYPIDVNNWPSQIALGYNSKLCIPTPGGQGLTMNATLATSSLAQSALYSAGGYPLKGDLSNSANDANAIKTMVGYGTGNVATQYGGALCASIGTLAAAKRNCGVGIAYTDPNHKRDGSLSPRGVVLNAATNGAITDNIPFGTATGYGVYGAAPGDKTSYANQVLRKYTSTAANKLPSLPTTAGAIDSWNNTTAGGSYSFTGADTAPLALSTSSNASALAANINRSAVSPLNLVPVDSISATDTDLTTSLKQTSGDLYVLNLHSIATEQSPLYGSGGGRWFFKSPADGSKPMMDIASIYQGSSYILTGQLSGLPATNPTLSQAFISNADVSYADWNGDPTTGTLYIDRAGQYPATVSNDADRAARLNAAMQVKRPQPNFGLGGEQTCAITTAGGGVKCWGFNIDGQMGNGVADLGNNVPQNVIGLSSGVQAIAAARNTTCALTTKGGVKCWGANEHGQLGSGTIGVDQLTPADVPGLTSGVTAISAGDSHVCAIVAGGAVKCWGWNDFGQLGNGTTGDLITPVTVPGLTGVVAIASGNTNTCALTSAGGVKCWGGNYYGQLGRGTNTYQEFGIADVTGLTSGVVDISTHSGSDHVCATLFNGSLKCWGSNAYGQLGDGTLTDRWTPVAVSGFGAGTAVSASAGTYHTCAITVGGGTKCWGANDLGQLGDGTTTQRLTPVSVSGLTSGVTSVLGGVGHSCARLATGDLKCWGSNHSGCLGDGTQDQQNTPVAVTTSNGSINNGAPMTSQGSVLVHQEITAGGDPVAGHIEPIPWSMSNSVTGNTSLIVSYDPLAAAAAVFIEQYDAHIAACNATSSESITQAQQAAGTYLWACSNTDAKATYLSGMQTLLNGARHYLFGSDTGCIKSTQTVAGSSCATTTTGPDPVHYPYTFVVPAYASYDSGFSAALTTAIGNYQTAMINSSATRLERTLQLASVRSFAAGSDAVVTTRVVRQGATNPTSCVLNDGFSSKLQ